MRTGAISRSVVGALVALAMLAAACSSGDGPDAEGSDATDGEFVLPPTTKVLGDDSLELLDSVDDAGTLTFAESTDVVASLDEGDVVIAGVSAHTPGGLMRKVESITTRGDEVTLTTEVAALDEAIERGHLEFGTALSLADADLDHPETWLADGVELVDAPDGGIPGRTEGEREDEDDGVDGDDDDTSEDDEGALGRAGGTPTDTRTVQLATRPIAQTRGARGGGELIALNDVVLHRGAEGQVTVSGSLAIEPDLDIVLDIDDFQLDEFTVNLSVNEGVALRLDATGTATPREDVTVASIVLAVIAIPVAPPPLTIVITPRIDVVVTASGSIEADLHASVVQNASASLGFGWKDGGFASFADSDSDFVSDPPEVAGRAAGQIALGGRLGLCFWGVFCGYAQADGFVGIDADTGDPPPCIDWELSAGLKAMVGIDLPLVVARVREDATVLDEREVLDQFRCDEDGGSGGGGQASGSPWARSYAGDRGAEGFAIETTRDGGSIVAGNAGFSSSFGGGTTLWVTKLDPDGDIEWEYQYFGAGAARAVRETGGGYYVAASSGEVLKLSPRGGLIWARRYAVNDDNGQPVGISLQAMEAMGDGSAVVAGVVSSAATSDDIVVLEIAGNGDVDWSRRYGGAGSDVVGGLALGNDGDMLVAGTTTGSPGGKEAAWLLHLDPTGSIGWQKAYSVDWTSTDGGVEPTQFRAVAAAPDGGFVVGGKIGPWRYAPGCDAIQIESGACDNTGSEGWVGWVARVDRTGAMTWSTALSVATFNPEIFAVTYAGSSVVAAGSLGLGEDQNVWAVQLGGKDGEVGWSRTFGGSRYDTTAPLILRGGSQYIDVGGSGVRIVGTSNSFSDRTELWVLDMTRTGQVNFDDDGGASIRYVSGPIIPTLAVTGPTGDTTVGNRTADTNATATNAGVRDTELTDDIEVAETKATVRTQGDG